MKTDQTDAATEFDTEEKTKPVTIDAALRQHARDAADAVPVPVEDVPTQPIKAGTVWKEPDFDEEEPTLVPTGD